MGKRGLQHRRGLGRGWLLGPHTESKLGASQCNEHHRLVTSAALTRATCVQLTAFQHGLPFGLFTRHGPISAMASCTPFRHGADIIQVVCTQRSPLISAALHFSFICSEPHNLDHRTHHSGAILSLSSSRPPVINLLHLRSLFYRAGVSLRILDAACFVTGALGLLTSPLPALRCHLHRLVQAEGDPFLMPLTVTSA